MQTCITQVGTNICPSRDRTRDRQLRSQSTVAVVMVVLYSLFTIDFPSLPVLRRSDKQDHNGWLKTI